MYEAAGAVAIEPGPLGANPDDTVPILQEGVWFALFKFSFVRIKGNEIFSHAAQSMIGCAQPKIAFTVFAERWDEVAVEQLCFETSNEPAALELA
jgi:hypothetical protein